MNPTSSIERSPKRRRSIFRAQRVRIGRPFLVLFLVSLATFSLLELVPGDPALMVLGPDANRSEYEEMRVELGLDRPLVERYVEWLTDALRGDLGQSLQPPYGDVSNMFRSAFPVTLEISLLAMGLALLVAIPSALLSAYRINGVFDRWANSVAYAMICLPTFLAGLLVIYLLIFNRDPIRVALLAGGLMASIVIAWRAVARSVTDVDQGRRATLLRGLALAACLVLVTALLVAYIPTFPRQGFVRWTDDRGIAENLRAAFLPALALAIGEVGIFTRILRNDLVVTLQEDFVLSARAKGIPPRRVLLSDALRPSSLSLVTVAGLSLGRLLGGTVVVETIFNLPGMGRLVVDAARTSDFRVVQGGVLVMATFYVVLNTLVDLTYSYLDPRIRRDRV